MNKKKKWIITAIVLVVFCLILGLYNLLNDKAPARMTPPKRRSRPADRAPSTSTDASSVRSGSPTASPRWATCCRTRRWTSRSKPRAKSWRSTSRRAPSSAKGELLAKVNDLPLVAQLSRYEAQLKLAEDRVYRQSALLKKDAVSQEAYEQARTELAMLNADIDIVKSNIALTELRAPFDGVIGLRNVSEGAYASPSVVVAKLTKISPLKIDFFVPERYANQIKPGTRLSFTIEGRQERFEAAVYATESKVDIATRTLAVRAKYPNTRGKLLPGRFATVQIRMHEIPDAIAIPTEALVPEMGVDKVFLYKGGKAHAAEVKTGLRTDSSIQIIDGLNVGDTLITSGTLQLREGLPVKLDTVE